MRTNTIYHINSLIGLDLLPSNSINSCVTSPPYYGLRNYDAEGQIGLEPTPEEFIGELVEVFEGVRRVLRPDGTAWIVIGDSYAGSGRGWTFTGFTKQTKYQGFSGMKPFTSDIYKAKDLIGIPFMLAFALRAKGWYLRQILIWSKPNGKPESVTDRCTGSHEYILLLSKSKKYYFDYRAIEQIAKTQENRPIAIVRERKLQYKSKRNVNPEAHLQKINYLGGGNCIVKQSNDDGTNTARKRSVWTVATQPYKGAHFATYPPELIRDCIRAGCPPGGVVLDPFGGSGTTAEVAIEEGREYILFEINKNSVDLANERILKTLLK